MAAAPVYTSLLAAGGAVLGIMAYNAYHEQASRKEAKEKSLKQMYYDGEMPVVAIEEAIASGAFREPGGAELVETMAGPNRRTYHLYFLPQTKQFTVAYGDVKSLNHAL